MTPSAGQVAANHCCRGATTSSEQAITIRRVRLWIIAVLTIATTGPLVGLSTAAQAGTTLNRLD